MKPLLPRRFPRRLVPVVALGVGLALGRAAPATAQPCNAEWTNPVVCEARVGVAAPGDRIQEMLGNRPISIPAGSSVDVEVQGVDQFGRAFPADRMLTQLEADRMCGGLLTLEETGEGRFSVTAGTQRGSCRLFLWVPGNLNLEWTLEVEVVSVAARGYTREQAEFLVTRLYRAALGREAEPAGLQSQTAEVLRGRLENVVAGMYQSSEFLTERSRRTPTEQLEDLYRALLGREADAEGIRSHLGQLEQRRYIDVTLHILRSPEFEQALLEATDH